MLFNTEMLNLFNFVGSKIVMSAMSTQKDKVKIKDQVSALKNLPSFFRLIWETSKTLTIANVGLRLLKAGVPSITLYIGKLIVDEVIRLIAAPEKNLTTLWLLLAAELGFTVLSDLLNRGITLADNEARFEQLKAERAKHRYMGLDTEILGHEEINKLTNEIVASITAEEN
jgi:hypothetical protein